MPTSATFRLGYLRLSGPIHPVMSFRCLSAWWPSLLGHSCARWGVASPLAGRATGLQGTVPVSHDQTPSGLPCSTLLRCDWGRVLSILRGLAVPARARAGVRAFVRTIRYPYVCGPDSPSLLLTVPASKLTKPRREFTFVHPSHLPLARFAREQALLRRCLLASDPSVTGGARRMGDRPGH
jgi:hypothetical protein